jgi:signal transduction histidine kinase
MNELFPSDFAQKMVEDDIRILNQKEKIEIDEEFNNRYYSTIKFPIQVEGGTKFLAGFTIDITDRKIAEKKLKELTNELKASNAAKDKFFSIMAHDLRSPFSSIAGLSELMIDEAPSLDTDEIIKYATVIHTSAVNTLLLLENLLDWALMQRRQIFFTPESIVLNDLVKEIFDLVNESAFQKSITLFDKIPNQFIINGDQNMIKTLIRNLVYNAIKFTMPGGSVEISAVVNTDEIQISVTDTGIGISSGDIEKLFNISTSYSNRGTSNEKGTGLGLILCKDFVDKHNGRIWIESKLGVGTTIVFTLPKNQVNTV